MTTELITRRGLLTGLGALIAAPAIVRVGSLMPVKSLPAELLAGDAQWLLINDGGDWQTYIFKMVIKADPSKNFIVWSESVVAQAA